MLETSKEHLLKFCKLHGGHLPCQVCNFDLNLSPGERDKHEGKLKELEILNQGGRL